MTVDVHPRTADDMRLVVLAAATEIAAGLHRRGDRKGAEAIVTLIQALEAFPQAPDALEPCAIRHSFDGHGWQYLDSGSGSDWFERGMTYDDGEVVYAAGG